MIQTPKVFSFIPGKKYYITDKKHISGGHNAIGHDKPLFTFEYVKRINKIHLFREVNLGWERGISDVQLLDKNIREINS